MAAPSFVGAGTGVTVTTGTGTVSKSCTSGNFVILQVYYDGLVGDWGIGTYVGLNDLAGSAGLTFVTTTPVGSTANYSLFMGRASTTGTCSAVLTVGASGEDLVARIYELSNVVTGTTLAAVMDNNEANSAVGTSTSVAASVHATHGTDRLVIELVGINAAQAVASYTGESVGDYTLAVTEYQGGGTVGTIALQTAVMSSANTISGGTFTITSAAWGTWGTSLLPGAGVTTETTIRKNYSVAY